jgi:hypothetical protein
MGNMLNKIPLELVRKIYSYDSTYKEYFDMRVIPYLERIWAIKYVDKNEGSYGLDYSHFEILPMRCNMDPDEEYNYTLNEAERICSTQGEYARRKGKEIYFIPEHKLKGDGTGCHLLNHKNLTYLIRL